jgi:hypothetical protein
MTSLIAIGWIRLIDGSGAGALVISYPGAVEIVGRDNSAKGGRVRQREGRGLIAFGSTVGNSPFPKPVMSATRP